MMYVYFLKIFPLTVRVHFTTVFLFHYFSKLCSSDLSRYFLNLNFYLIKYVKKLQDAGSYTVYSEQVS